MMPDNPQHAIWYSLPNGHSLRGQNTHPGQVHRLFQMDIYSLRHKARAATKTVQYPAERYVGIQDCHIRDWQPARQPTIPSSDAEGNRELTCIYFSKESSTLAKVLKGLQADGHST